MKKILLLFAGLLLMSSYAKVDAQIISESAKRKVSIGIDIFTDIWLNEPANMSMRTAQQGANVFLQYNFKLGNSHSTSFAMGIGIDNHNMYSNAIIKNIKADTIVFVPLSNDVKYKRSKVNIVSVTAPIELKFRTKMGFKISAGMKLGYIIDNKEKYVGEPPSGGPEVNQKIKGISQFETLTFGPTLRIGYKFINLYGYYQISSVFRMGHGPQLSPLSIGITLTPF